MKSKFCSILLLLLAASLIDLTVQKVATIYDPSKTNTLILNRDNFDKQITKHRAKQVSVIHFFKNDDDGSRDIAIEFEKFASDWQGAFRIATVNCYEFFELCEKEQIAKTPTIKIYPILPVPPFEYEGDQSSKGWTGSASRFVHSNIIEINSTTVNKFTTENPSVPKALLFTDKPGSPLIWKALSVAFDKKIFLGIVRQGDEQKELFTKYGARKTPHIVVIKPSDKKVVAYDGDLKYSKIFDFLNIYTETFVPGGENLDFEKPWNREVFPELTAKSGNDICFGADGFCGIYLTKQAPDASSTAVIEHLLKLQSDIKFKYMWLNVETQDKFAKIFAVEEYPALVIFSHGKRKKYLVHEGPVTKESVEATLEKLTNGDARFKYYNQETLPPLN